MAWSNSKVFAAAIGAALDLGKMIALMAGQKKGLSVWDLEDVDDWWNRADAAKIAPIIAVPTTLVYSAYSREFESEADDYAFTALKRRGKSALAFAAVMGKLEAAVDKINDGEDDDTWSYLSSHPDTQERIEAAKRASLR